MTLATQTKLLRVLQEREFERVGSNTPIKVDIRVITATNRDLVAEVEGGRFREDLYYRLNVIHIDMPPLRDRRDDIPALVEHFLVKYRHAPGAIPTTISEEALALLTEHDWPGNVRELENAIERAVVLSRGNPITTEHLAFTEPPIAGGSGANGAAGNGGKGAGKFKKQVGALERQLIVEALERANGNRTKAAEELGIYRRLLYAKIREYGLE